MNTANKSSTINAFCTVVRMRGATVHAMGAHGAVIACTSTEQALDVASVACKRNLAAQIVGLDVFVD